MLPDAQRRARAEQRAGTQSDRGVYVGKCLRSNLATMSRGLLGADGLEASGLA